MSKQDEIFRLEAVSVGYKEKHGDKVILSGLDASLRRGRLTALLGSNGIGKSTLLRTMCAFQPLLGGRILLDGKSIQDMDPKTLSRTLSVVLTERPQLFNMTCLDTVCLGRSPYTGFFGTLTKEDKAKSEEALALVGMTSFRDRLMQTLSDGERQKVMIAKSLAQDTPVVLLDEPTAFLDYPSKVEMMRLLQRLTRKTGKTILLSSHDVDLALKLSDELWILDREDKARLIVGAPEDLALSGSLEGYFSSKDIEYHAKEAVLGINKPEGLKGAYLENAPEYSRLLQQGLLRHGYQIIADRETSDCRIFYKGAEGFTLEKDQTERTFPDFAQLLDSLD